MNKNLKYDKFFFYLNDIIYDINNKVINSNHYIYKIINYYKIPKHLFNVKIIDNKTLDEAHNNLVFFGEDKNGKIQYFYGIYYIKNRKFKKLIIFSKVYNNINNIKDVIISNINTCIKEKKINKIFIISSIILLEINTFIRLGKESSFKLNGTFGIRNLLKTHIDVFDDYILIEFVGKKNVEYKYKINKEDNLLLYKTIKILKFQNNNSDYLFSYNNELLSEYTLNSFLKEYDITFKDLRLYGVNIEFFKNLFNFLKDIKYDSSNLIKTINKVIKQSLELTSQTIQHTKTVSKNSYIIELDIDILVNYLKNIKNIKDLNNFINFIINKSINNE